MGNAGKTIRGTTPKQQKFVEFLGDGLAPTDAYMAAYGKERHYAKRQIWRVMRVPEVQAGIFQQLADQGLRAAKVGTRLARIIESEDNNEAIKGINTLINLTKFLAPTHCPSCGADLAKPQKKKNFAGDFSSADLLHAAIRRINEEDIPPKDTWRLIERLAKMLPTDAESTG